jgi:hypothetical protein
VAQGVGPEFKPQYCKKKKRKKEKKSVYTGTRRQPQDIPLSDGRSLPIIVSTYSELSLTLKRSPAPKA